MLKSKGTIKKKKEKKKMKVSLIVLLNIVSIWIYLIFGYCFFLQKESESSNEADLRTILGENEKWKDNLILTKRW